jgi:hypothetical protein
MKWQIASRKWILRYVTRPVVELTHLADEVHEPGDVAPQLLSGEPARVFGGDRAKPGHERIAPSVDPLPAVLEPKPAGQGP